MDDVANNWMGCVISSGGIRTDWLSSLSFLSRMLNGRSALAEMPVAKNYFANWLNGTSETSGLSSLICFR